MCTTDARQGMVLLYLQAKPVRGLGCVSSDSQRLKIQNLVWKSLYLKAMYTTGVINAIKFNLWFKMPMVIMVFHMWYRLTQDMSHFTNISLFSSDLGKSAAISTQ